MNDQLREKRNFRAIDTAKPCGQVWTGGVGSNIARKNVWFWHSDTDKLMEYRHMEKLLGGNRGKGRRHIVLMRKQLGNEILLEGGGGAVVRVADLYLDAYLAF
jgi:hypothetical protein